MTHISLGTIRGAAVAMTLAWAGTALVAGGAPQNGAAADRRRPSAATSRRLSSRSAPAATGRARWRRCRCSSFKDVRPWAGAIREKVATRVMPPWHADRSLRHVPQQPEPEPGARSTRSCAWVDGGAREGNPKDVPALPTFAEGWQIGKPDQVFEMAADFEVPARGTIDYQYFEVPTNFTEDRWMQAGRSAGRRSRARAPHHRLRARAAAAAAAGGRARAADSRARATAAPPARRAGRRGRATSGAAAGAPAASRTTDNMLVNWAVGEDAPVYLPGMAKRIPAGSTLIFQVHYTTNGTAGRDRSRLGLIFAKEPPAQEIRTAAIANPLFAIPGGAQPPPGGGRGHVQPRT